MRPAPAAALALLAVVGSALAADPPQPAPTPPAATKGTLPRDWKKLGLTDDQKLKAYAITAAAKEKVAKLEAELAAVKEEEHKQLAALLTDDQRKHLAELLTGDAPADKPLSPPAKDK